MAKKTSANKSVAFLRGINVGGNRKIEMGTLKKFFEKLKYQNVSTILNTGNVIFETDRTEYKKNYEKSLESGLTKQFKYPARVIVYNISNVEKVIQGYPFDSNEADSQHYVVFLSSEIGVELATLFDWIKNLKKLLSEMELFIGKL